MKKLTEKELVEIVDAALKKFKGDSSELETAIGMLFLARKCGWKVAYLVHNKRTIKKYEGILGISIREHFPEEGELAHRSLAFKLLKGVTNFWKAVQGDIPGIRSKILQ